MSSGRHDFQQRLSMLPARISLYSKSLALIAIIQLISYDRLRVLSSEQYAQAERLQQFRQWIKLVNSGTYILYIFMGLSTLHQLMAVALETVLHRRIGSNYTNSSICSPIMCRRSSSRHVHLLSTSSPLHVLMWIMIGLQNITYHIRPCGVWWHHVLPRPINYQPPRLDSKSPANTPWFFEPLPLLHTINRYLYYGVYSSLMGTISPPKAKISLLSDILG